MKIKLQRERDKRGQFSSDYRYRWKHWKEAKPFNVNHRGVLVHRVRYARSCFIDGEYSHDIVVYWCGGSSHSGGGSIDLTDDPPKSRLLCQTCEQKAVAAGEDAAAKIAGRHVHVGHLRAVRTCCSDQNN